MNRLPNLDFRTTPELHRAVQGRSVGGKLVVLHELLRPWPVAAGGQTVKGSVGLQLEGIIHQSAGIGLLPPPRLFAALIRRGVGAHWPASHRGKRPSPEHEPHGRGGVCSGASVRWSAPRTPSWLPGSSCLGSDPLARKFPGGKEDARSVAASLWRFAQRLAREYGWPDDRRAPTAKSENAGYSRSTATRARAAEPTSLSIDLGGRTAMPPRPSRQRARPQMAAGEASRGGRGRGGTHRRGEGLAHQTSGSKEHLAAGTGFHID